MSFTIVEESIDRLKAYGEIPIRFEVKSIFEIEGNDPETATLVEKQLAHPWTNDYDAVAGKSPTSWPNRWDITNWGLLVAYADGKRVGGCVLAFNTRGIHKLEGRDDLTALWDIRVCPNCRGMGVGRQLFEGAITWAKERHCHELKVETQNINVPACCFYKKQDCRLTAIRRGTYEDSPDEIELIWSLTL
ncbi:MAG: GNAT family N-acetyltransferase [Cyanobacteria bacterium P01_A01_bin.17]